MSEKASEDDINNEKLQDLIDQRIEEKKEEIKKEAKKEAKKELQGMRSDSNSVASSSKASEGISRRDFLKKAGLGSVGLAALGFTSVSGLDVRSNNFSVFANSGNTRYFSIGESGPVNVHGTELNLNEQSIIGVGGLTLPNSQTGEEDCIWVDENSQQLKARINGVVFTAASIIPDSAIHRFILDENSMTVEDRIGSLSGDVSGANWVSGDWMGSYSLEFGNSDSDNIDIGENFIPSSGAVSLTFTFNKFTENQFLFRDSSHNIKIVFSSGDQQLKMDAGTPELGAVSTTNLNTNTPYRLVVNYDKDANDYEWYLNRSVETVAANGGSGNTGGIYQIGAGGDSGSWNGIIDDFIVYNSYLSVQEIEEDYNRQPWS